MKPDLKRLLATIISIKRSGWFLLIGIFILLLAWNISQGQTARIPFVAIALLSVTIRAFYRAQDVGSYRNKKKDHKEKIELKDRFPTLLPFIRSDFKDINLLFRDNPSDQIVFKLLEVHKLSTYLWRFSRGYLPDVLSKQVQAAFEVSAQSYYAALSMINDIFSRAKIAGLHFVVVEGIALNDCIYDIAGTRVCRDIDILINPEDKMSLQKLIREMGINHSEENPIDKGDFVSVNVHDELKYLTHIASQTMFEGAIQSKRIPALSPELTFILLLTNIYANSESFNSNVIEYKQMLRDYVDIRFFFDKYHDVLDWNKIEELIKTFGLQKIAGVVLGNLTEIYDRDVSFRCLPHIEPLSSEWGVSILERIQYPDIAKTKVLRIMRAHWIDAGATSPIIVHAISSQNIKDESQRWVLYCGKDGQFFTVYRFHGVFVLSLVLPFDIQESEKILCQFKFYILDESAEYTVYNVVIYQVNNSPISYGYKTMEYDLCSIRKEIGSKLVVDCEEVEGKTFVNVQLPYSKFEPLDVHKDETFCLSCGLYEERDFDNYRRWGRNTDEEDLHLLVFK